MIRAVQKPKVLIIDDDVHMREFMRNCITGLDCFVLEASHADEAMTIMNAVRVDVVVTDFRMPVTSGLELTKMIRVIDAEVPVVLCSSDLLIDEDEVRAAGVTQMIPKDIDHALALRSFVSEHLSSKVSPR